jgi:hypothetical protein
VLTDLHQSRAACSVKLLQHLSRPPVRPLTHPLISQNTRVRLI